MVFQKNAAFNKIINLKIESLITSNRYQTTFELDM